MISILISLFSSYFMWSVVLLLLNRLIVRNPSYRQPRVLAHPTKRPHEKVLITPAAIAPVILLCVGILLLVLAPELSQRGLKGLRPYHVTLLVLTTSCAAAYIHLLKRIRGSK